MQVENALRRLDTPNKTVKWNLMVGPTTFFLSHPQPSIIFNLPQQPNPQHRRRPRSRRPRPRPRRPTSALSPGVARQRPPPALPARYPARLYGPPAPPGPYQARPTPRCLASSMASAARPRRPSAAAWPDHSRAALQKQGCTVQ
jgi:hypothetical protein